MLASLLMKPLLLALPVLLALWPARSANAQSVADREQYRSTKNFAIELRIGPYTPGIDREFANLPAEQRPHEAYFGKDSALLFQTEIDYQFMQEPGTLAIGLGLGYLQQSAKAFIEPAAGTIATTRSGDGTALKMIPLSLSLVYRMDLLARHANIPLVPYGKVGVDYSVWYVTNGNGNFAKAPDGTDGYGGTPGWHAAVGLSLLLDVFDPGASQALDAEIGVNHTLAFVEYGHYDYSGLGQSNKLQLGDTTWTAGVMFEF
jgi:hypothetical protein